VKIRRWIQGLAAPVLLSPVGGVAVADEGPELKFRDRGPTCMCVGGLSEEDIRRSQRREDGAENPPEDSALDDNGGIKDMGIDKPRGEQ